MVSLGPILNSPWLVNTTFGMRPHPWRSLVRAALAHHPTAIAGTLNALRARYPGARLWAILEPRSNTLRRRILQGDLARSLALADEIIVAGVFRSEAVPANERLELPELIAEILKHG